MRYGMDRENSLTVLPFCVPDHEKMGKKDSCFRFINKWNNLNVIQLVRSIHSIDLKIQQF